MLSKRLVLHETVVLNSCPDSRPLWFLNLLEETKLKSKWSWLGVCMPGVVTFEKVQWTCRGRLKLVASLQSLQLTYLLTCFLLWFFRLCLVATFWVVFKMHKSKGWACPGFILSGKSNKSVYTGKTNMSFDTKDMGSLHFSLLPCPLCSHLPLWRCTSQFILLIYQHLTSLCTKVNGNGSFQVLLSRYWGLLPWSL